MFWYMFSLHTSQQKSSQTFGVNWWNKTKLIFENIWTFIWTVFDAGRWSICTSKTNKTFWNKLLTSKLNSVLKSLTRWNGYQKPSKWSDSFQMRKWVLKKVYDKKKTIKMFDVGWLVYFPMLCLRWILKCI